MIATSAGAYAQPQLSEGEKKAAARAAYTEGVELQDKGKPAEALTRFEAAQKLFDAPTHLLHLAECQAMTGKLVEASETYETLIRKTLPPGSPEVFVQSQEQGKAELASLRQRIPTMKVRVKPDPATLTNLQISVNDRQMPAELVGIARPVNPGPYRILATATGWATPQAATTEVADKDAKDVELTLVQGAAVPTPGAAPVAGAPPPYDAPKPRPNPSQTGLLIGARGAAWVPGGDLVKDRKLDDFMTAGGGFGIDAYVRVARLVLVGATFEYGSFGASNARKQALPNIGIGEFSTHSVLGAAVVGVVPNIDKVSFIGDVSLGYRSLSQSVTFTPTGSSARTLKFDDVYGGLEVGLTAGLSIPAGPLRFVPKAGVSAGSFTSRECTLTTGISAGCVGRSNVVSSAHTFLSVMLGLYFNHDFSKPAPAPATASR